MRAREFITETHYGSAADTPADARLMAKSAVTAIKGAISMPNLSQNKQDGSPYLQWRFSVAMAGAPDYPTPPTGAIAGDPLLATYTDADLAIINSAAKMIGVGEVKKITDNRSREHEAVHKISPVKPFAGYAR